MQLAVFDPGLHATDFAARRVARWQKFYMRAMQARQDGRRGKRPVMVEAAGNVNIGQQLNN